MAVSLEGRELSCTQSEDRSGDYLFELAEHLSGVIGIGDHHNGVAVEAEQRVDGHFYGNIDNFACANQLSEAATDDGEPEFFVDLDSSSILRTRSQPSAVSAPRSDLLAREISAFAFTAAVKA